jgi:hypothetical protein
MMPVNIEDFRRLAPGAACLTWFSTTWMAASVTESIAAPSSGLRSNSVNATPAA